MSLVWYEMLSLHINPDASPLRGDDRDHDRDDGDDDDMLLLMIMLLCITP